MSADALDGTATALCVVTVVLIMTVAIGREFARARIGGPPSWWRLTHRCGLTAAALTGGTMIVCLAVRVLTTL